MTGVKRARIELIFVAALGAFLLGFVISKIVVDDVNPLTLIPVLFVVAVLSLPTVLWRTPWRRRATEITAIASVLFVIPSFVFFGPVFLFPAALLANVAARQLRNVAREGGN